MNVKYYIVYNNLIFYFFFLFFYFFFIIIYFYIKERDKTKEIISDIIDTEINYVFTNDS